jgi:arginase
MDIAIICVPYQNDMARWGVARAPQTYLDTGLIDALSRTGHTVLDPVWIELPNSERTRDTVTNLGNIARHTAAAVAAALRRSDETFVIVLEGDCTHAVGAVGGLAQAKGVPGIIWFDAHGDMNTMETTTSGMWGGMPYAVALGWEFADWREAAGLEQPVRPEAAALIGTSDLDPAEIEALQRHPILHIEATELMQPDSEDTNIGLEVVLPKFRGREQEAASWYMHIDVDVAGPEVAPGGLTPAPYWPPRQNIINSASAIASHLPVDVVSLAAYNPWTDTERVGAKFGIEMLVQIVINKDTARKS